MSRTVTILRMRRAICVVMLGVAVAGCGSSSNDAAPPTGAAGSVPAPAPAITFDQPPQTGQLPDAPGACGRLQAAVGAFSESAFQQPPPSLVPAPDGNGSACSMSWQEAPPSSSQLTTDLLFYSESKMDAEMQRMGWGCDPTPEVVAGFPDGFTCSRTTTDGPAIMIRLDSGGQSMGLSLSGLFTGGVTAQDALDALVLVLALPEPVLDTIAPASTVPVITPVPTIMTLPPVSTTLGVPPLPSTVWDGTYVAEPSSGALQIGDRGSRVTALQRNLGLHGLLDPPFDGYFGPDTETAVVSFQQEARMRVTGIADPELLQAVQTS